MIFPLITADKRLNGTLGSPAGITTPLKGVATKSNKQPQSSKLKSTAITKNSPIVGVSEGKCQKKEAKKVYFKQFNYVREGKSKLEHFKLIVTPLYISYFPFFWSIERHKVKAYEIQV